MDGTWLCIALGDSYIIPIQEGRKTHLCHCCTHTILGLLRLWGLELLDVSKPNVSSHFTVAYAPQLCSHGLEDSVCVGQITAISCAWGQDSWVQHIMLLTTLQQSQNKTAASTAPTCRQLLKNTKKQKAIPVWSYQIFPSETHLKWYLYKALCHTLHSEQVDTCKWALRPLRSVTFGADFLQYCLQ